MKIRCATKKPFHLVHGQPMKQPIHVAARALRVQHSKWKRHRLSWHHHLCMDNEWENSLLCPSWSDKEIYNDEDLQAARGFCSVGQIGKGCRFLSRRVLCALEALCERKWWRAESHLLCHLARLPPPVSSQVGTEETPSGVVWTRRSQDTNLLGIRAFHTTYISRCAGGFIYLLVFFSPFVMEDLLLLCEGWRS